MLVPQPSCLTWGKKRVYDNFPNTKKMIGYTPTMGLKRAEACIRRYLSAVIPCGLQDPGLGNLHDFMPAGAPLLDILAVY